MEALLSGHVAVVTGGGRDLGRDIALALAREGADVVVSGRNRGPLDKTAQDIRDLGRRSLAVVADVTKETDVVELFRVVTARLGYVSLLVNNAAAERLVSAVADMPLANWNETIATKLTGAMLCSREALKLMIPRKRGVIINISGTTGIEGAPYVSAHSVAQRGLIGLTQSLAREVGKEGIRVNAIVPSAIEGESLRRQMAARQRGPEHGGQDRIKALAASSPLGRLVQAREVADTVVFLASDRASGITGQAINLLLQ